MARTLAEWVELFPKESREKYTYLSVSGAKARITYLCPDHGKVEQSAHHHKNGVRCRACSAEANGERCRLTKEQCLERFRAKHGQTYEYGEYDWQFVEVICPKHGMEKKTTTRHIAGDGCTKCGNEKIGKAIALSEEEALARCKEAYGDRFSYTEFYVKESRTRVKFTCSIHGEQDRVLKEHLKGHGCAECAEEAKIKRCKESRRSAEDWVKLSSEKYPWNIYTGATAGEGITPTIDMFCEKHGDFTVVASDHLSRGNGCPSCGNRVSLGQIGVRNFIRSLGLECEVEVRMSSEEHITKGVWVDLVVPEKKIAIEFMGLIWHSSKFKDSGACLRRKKLLESHGYQFIGIYEDEWKFRKRVVREMLRSRLGKVEKSIGARKLEVREVGQAQATAFYNEHHIQGSVSRAAHLGLYDGTRLQACASFTEQLSGRKNKDNVAELIRYATDYHVQGGLSKLCKAFFQRSPSTQVIESFSDDRLFSGKAYEQSGFEKLYTTSPDYKYVINKHRYHKSGFQKSRLVEMFPNVDVTKTEKEITESLEIYRIFDCGKTKWQLVRP